MERNLIVLVGVFYFFSMSTKAFECPVHIALNGDEFVAETNFNLNKTFYDKHTDLHYDILYGRKSSVEKYEYRYGSYTVPFEHAATKFITKSTFEDIQRNLDDDNVGSNAEIYKDQEGRIGIKFTGPLSIQPNVGRALFDPPFPDAKFVGSFAQSYEVVIEDLDDYKQGKNNELIYEYTSESAYSKGTNVKVSFLNSGCIHKVRDLRVHLYREFARDQL